MSVTSRFSEPFAARLRHDVRHRDGGAVLVGGSPLRVVRLHENARLMLAEDVITVDGAASAALIGRLVDGNLADPCPSAVHQALEDELTVVIPVRDRPEQLDRCLSSVAPLSCIVVDDASTDPAATRAIAARHGARCVLLAENAGPASARNAGLREVETPLVAFVDSDVTASSATLLALTAHFADWRVAMVGPRVRGAIRSPRPRRVETHDALTSSLDMGPQAASVQPGARVAWLPSACLVARVDRLGAGFDVTMHVGEDVDLVWRLVAAGERVRYDPDHVVGHDVRSTVHEWLERKFAYGTSGALLAARHGDRVAPAELSAPYAVAAALLLARRPSALPVSLAVLAHGIRRVARRLPATQSRIAVATSLNLRGLGSAVEQESALVLRHWWPLAATGGLMSVSIRRAVVSALMVDVCLGVRRHPELGSWSHLVLRRLDDLAYGAGLWWGVIRDRDARSLLVRSPGRGSRSGDE